jgi:hypothetical protein
LGADSRELFCVSLENKLMAVNLKVGADSVEPSTPRELSSLPALETGWSPYEVAPDGQRFLVRATPGGVVQPLNVIVNWPALLNKGASHSAAVFLARITNRIRAYPALRILGAPTTRGVTAACFLAPRLTHRSPTGHRPASGSHSATTLGLPAVRRPNGNRGEIHGLRSANACSSTAKATTMACSLPSRIALARGRRPSTRAHLHRSRRPATYWRPERRSGKTSASRFVPPAHVHTTIQST